MTKWLCLIVFGAVQIAEAAPSRPDFHRLVYELHEKQIANHAIRTEEKTGAYHGTTAAGYRYRITSYYDAKTGRLLSRIQRDADVPEAIHISEVNIYGIDGRLTRDYLSIAPPWKPVHPSNAYLNLHHYSGKLHSFRQFELDGLVNYEFCEGELDGKPVGLSMPWEDMNKVTTSTPEYRACFDKMDKGWKQLITPQ